MKYLAHKSPEDNREQPLVEHLQNTSMLARQFAATFGAQEDASLAGLLHDLGKYSLAFQRRLNNEVGLVDHSTAGALEAYKLKNLPVAMCIAGHHSGLLDIGSIKNDSYGQTATFAARLNAKPSDIEDYSAYKEEITAPTKQQLVAYNKCDGFFYTHMLYSCLVDADFLDTESFMSNGKVERGSYATLEQLAKLMDERIKSWGEPIGDLNRKRSEILHAVLNAATIPRGLFSLTVPTGGGKTETSMAFALNHALANFSAEGKPLRRIIYVIPYVSIIEQTQRVFEKIFGEENVLAHYYNVQTYDNEDGSESQTAIKKRLAAENWDAPIVLTTAVQFFESLFANRSSACRKLHNIAGSVIIFDEAQMMPAAYLNPCLYAVAQLIENYYCSAILCTATQPAFDKKLNALLPNYPCRELCPQPSQMYEDFKRVTYVNEGLLGDSELVEKINAEEQVLCIVNTKKHAQALYALIQCEGSYHLSTTLYAQERSRILEEIRLRLKNKQVCRVISTSLIEAGVDVDFPTVFRAYAGLDSIIQSGGRCNRENTKNRAESIVHYFDTECNPPAYIRQNVAAAKHTIARHKDISSLEAVSEYFTFLLNILRGDEACDVKNIMQNIKTDTEFARISQQFRLINDSGYAVVIPEGKAADLYRQYKQWGLSKGLIRQLGRYTVSVYEDYFTQLIKRGYAELLTDGLAVLTNASLYDKNTGLALTLPDMDFLDY